ncbi:CDKN2A-interacting protein isoform X1 [Gracilinanus agilis]|uniref:CDKN2A-interacting protein isoform X1 n=1 Tax=Gracilinanus agilis TaxID=191870 RepID=UPI001CFD2BDD|nr:CDKN2A-interacting protein isoform X1 [Gracilinanus agilis]
MAQAAISEVSEYLSQNPRVAAWVETLRSDGETDKHWRHRREFLLRNAGDLAPTATTEAASVECGDRRRQLQQLVSSSMAWANHIFLGCRYPPKVMDKILSMAEGIKVTDAPIHTTRDELVAKVKKRGISSSNDGVEEPCKKRAVEGKNSSSGGQDASKTSGRTEQPSPKQEVKVGPVLSTRSVGSGENLCRSSSSTLERGSALSQEVAGVKSQNKSTIELTAENLGSKQSTSTSQAVAAGPEKVSDVETSDKHGTTLISSVTKSNSLGTQLTDSKQQNASPKKGVLESTSSLTSSLTSQNNSETEVPLLTSQSRSETSVPLLGSPSSSEVELPLLSSKPGSELLPLLGSKTTSDASTLQSTSKTNLESNISSSVSKNSSSPSVQMLTPKNTSSSSTSSSSTLLLTSKSSSQVAATLLASKSSSQAAASILASKSSSQTSGSLLAPKSSSLTSVSQLASKSSSQTSTSQLPSKSTSQTSESSVRFSCKLTTEDVKQKQPFFNRLYKTVAWKLVAVGGFSPNVNHGELLNASVEALKATLDVSFVPLKELADLPQSKSSQESIVCELRCKSVYLGTGCGKSKENAKAVASREALKLFLKKKVVVKICKRKYRGTEIEDLVLLDEESRPTNLPPALKHPQELP